MKITFKQVLPYLTAIVVFVVVSIAYFTPVIFENKTPHQHDARAGAGASVDLNEYREAHDGERSLWESRMFSGMPSYQISPFYKAAPVQYQLRDAFNLWLPSPANFLFGYMLGFFLLLIALRVNPYISIIGAIAYAFSSYFIIIIGAGHIWKVWVLMFIPPTMAGIIWTYRAKYFIGAAVTALFFNLQLFSNHPQMVYYFLLVVGLFVVGRLVYDLMGGRLKQFAIATAMLLVAGGIGFAANSPNMILSAKYASQTIRGESELSTGEEKTGGVDRSYATGWSYGIQETATLLVPNTKGGATGVMGGAHADKMNAISDPQLKTFVANNFDSYWGNQPITSGPVYVGAFILFLFIFGAFVVKGYLKWVLLAATIFSILLSWGSNFSALTNWFLDYFPYYNKMRTVSSILVVAEFCIPILAILALVEIVKKPRLIAEKRIAFYTSLGCTAGFALLFIVAPKSFFSFLSNTEAAGLANAIKQDPVYLQVQSGLESVRVSVFRADAWRSLIFILLGVGMLLLYSRKIIGKTALILCVGAIILTDLFAVNKRYFNNDFFVPKSKTQVAYEMTPADQEILGDKDPNYRVLNRSVSTFNDASTSAYHKSIGGYHAAKLRRYQDVIAGYLSDDKNEQWNVLNMLNTRYRIGVVDQQYLQVQKNTNALGNAWFVDTIQWVANANEEFAALATLDPAKTAIIDKRFESQLTGLNIQPDTAATIKQETYEINDISYKAKSASEQLAVFSEIYYDDGLTRWDAFIDGKPTPIIRVNYILRAVRVPAGEHTVELRFKPKAHDTLEAISLPSLWVILLAMLGAVAFELIRQRKGQGKTDEQE